MRAIFRCAYTVRRSNIATIPHPGHVAMKLRNLQTDEMQWRMAAGKRVFSNNRFWLSQRNLFIGPNSKWPRLNSVPPWKTARLINHAIVGVRLHRDFHRISFAPGAAVAEKIPLEMKLVSTRALLD